MYSLVYRTKGYTGRGVSGVQGGVKNHPERRKWGREGIV